MSEIDTRKNALWVCILLDWHVDLNSGLWPPKPTGRENHIIGINYSRGSASHASHHHQMLSVCERIIRWSCLSKSKGRKKEREGCDSKIAVRGWILERYPEKEAKRRYALWCREWVMYRCWCGIKTLLSFHTHVVSTWANFKGKETKRIAMPSILVPAIITSLITLRWKKKNTWRKTHRLHRNSRPVSL